MTRGVDPTTLFWTPERVDYLVRKWAEGYSGGVIARELGTTRNAIVGKVSRLHLSAHAKPTRQYAITRVRTQRVARIKKQIAVVRSNVPERIKPPPMQGPELPPEIGIDLTRLRNRAWEPLEGSSPVPLYDLAPDGCTWPLGSGEAPYTFCAMPKHQHRSYCKEHFALSRRVAA